MAAQKYNNNQAHVFWSHDWRPQAYHDIYYSSWSCTPDLKGNHGSWGHELACAQTAPPPLPSGKIGEGHLLFFLFGGGVCTQASHEHVRGLPKTKKKSTVKFMHEFNWNSLKQLTFYWISGSASNQKLTLATTKTKNKTKTSNDVVLKTECV